MTTCGFAGCPRPARGRYCPGHRSQSRRGQVLRPLRVRSLTSEQGRGLVRYAWQALKDTADEDPALLIELERAVRLWRAAVVTERDDRHRRATGAP